MYVYRQQTDKETWKRNPTGYGKPDMEEAPNKATRSMPYPFSHSTPFHPLGPHIMTAAANCSVRVSQRYSDRDSPINMENGTCLKVTRIPRGPSMAPLQRRLSRQPANLFVHPSKSRYHVPSTSYTVNFNATTAPPHEEVVSL